MKLFILPLFAMLTSCSTFNGTCSDACQKHFDALQTAQQGKTKAKADIIDSGYKIYRYDMPIFRSGAWSSYDAKFEHFGIKELGGVFGAAPTLDYMKAYNTVMDNGLKKRYGSEYLKYRSSLLPAKNAGIYKYSTQ